MTKERVFKISRWNMDVDKQLYSIIKQKEAITNAYETNASSSSHSLGHRCRKSTFSDINDRLYEWYLLACSKNIYPDGPTLKSKAQEIAAKLEIEGFKASNGWFDKWKHRHSIKRVSVCGESGGLTVDSWKERLPEILANYKMEDIYNIDETGCFWRTLPDKGFGTKALQCKGGKKSKTRVTVALIANATGEKEDPIVIWTSKNFRGIQTRRQLPVFYFDQRNAWMTADIMYQIVGSFNRKMIQQKRSVLLLMDNAGCHPEDLRDKFSNVKVVFFPPNTTSKLQPLDLGIIKNFKVHYRRYLLSYILASIETCISASEVAKTITILDAIRWISKAWRDVKPETISKCFRRAGVTPSAIAVGSSDLDDPFDDIDLIEGMNDLISDVMGTGSEACSLDIYTSGENGLSVCAEFEDEIWDQAFMENLTENVHVQESDSEEEELETDVLPPPSKITSYRQALGMLKDVQTYLESRSALDEAFLTFYYYISLF